MTMSCNEDATYSWENGEVMRLLETILELEDECTCAERMLNGACVACGGGATDLSDV